MSKEQCIRKLHAHMNKRKTRKLEKKMKHNDSFRQPEKKKQKTDGSVLFS